MLRLSETAAQGPLAVHRACRNRQKKTPASVSVPNTYAQAMVSTQAEQWEAAMRKEHSSIDEHEVAYLIPSTMAPLGSTIIGTRWVFRIKTGGYFEDKLAVRGWAHQHGLDCFTTFAPVCRIEISVFCWRWRHQGIYEF